MGLKEIFQKQGGMNLIKQYAKSGSLGTAVGEFALLGKSRTALEILRLSTQLKVKQKLEKKYRSTLKEFDKNYDQFLLHESSNKVWICWFQGMENAPVLVQKCYESVKNNLTDRDVVLITSENMGQYVTFPDYIIEKWKTGVITNTHLTDLLRLELLIKYGGMWLDATVFCSEERKGIPNYFFDSELFFFQSLKPGRDGHCQYISSWLMSAKSHNKLLMATLALCYEYWRKNKSMDDYFLLHDFLSIVLDYYPEEWKSVIPRDNAAPHVLLLRLFDKYDQRLWEVAKAQTPFHKMTYKFKEKDTKLQDTYYKVIFG